MYQAKVTLRLLTSDGIEPRFATNVGLPGWQSKWIGVSGSGLADEGRSAPFLGMTFQVWSGEEPALLGRMFSVNEITTEKEMEMRRMMFDYCKSPYIALWGYTKISARLGVGYIRAGAILERGLYSGFYSKE